MFYTTLKNLKADPPFKSRGVKDAALFKTISPSVVLILTKDGLGSGSIINASGEILTNWHVVGNNTEVGVVLKPKIDTQKVSEADVRLAKVIKVDQISDIALIKLDSLPVGRKPIKLGDVSDISIGADVHAIGHPKGESWTYTKGIVSQYRHEYTWPGDNADTKHQADVIQTQTPINPGNSGGPLLNSEGVLVGINSFVRRDSEGLNFAVSIKDIKTFLSRKDSRLFQPVPKAEQNSKCEMKEIYKGKTADGSGETVSYDSQCKGKADIDITLPSDSTKAMIMRLDRNGDTKPDVIWMSYSRDYKWEISFWDNDFNGDFELVGLHETGKAEPTSFETKDNFERKLSAK